MLAVRHLQGNVIDFVGWPVSRIDFRVAEHVQEGRSEQLLGQPNALFPLPTDGVALVENGGDAALFL